MSTRNLFLRMNRIFIRALKIMRKMATRTIWILLKHVATNRMFCILREAGEDNRKVSK